MDILSELNFMKMMPIMMTSFTAALLHLPVHVKSTSPLK